MSQLLFGQCLGRVVNLSAHDVAEILEDQNASHRRFGEIALSWGLCQPEHIWRAWCEQLSRLTPEVDLAAVGIDAQALVHVPRSVVLEYSVVPVRSYGNELIIAADQPSAARAERELPRVLGKMIKLVIASRESIQQAIARYYPAEVRGRAVARN